MQTESVYAPPKSKIGVVRQESDIYCDDKFVVCEPDSQWPSRCYKSNIETDNIKTVKLFYFNPWFYLTILITPILTIILWYIFRKKIVIDLPLSEKHANNWQTFKIVQWSLAGLFIASILMGAILDMPMFFGFSMLLLLFILIATLWGGNRIYAAKYNKENNQFWLKGACQAFRDDLPHLN